MESFQKTIAAGVAAGLLMALACHRAEAQAPAPIVGNITFAGTVNLDQPSVNNATQVTGWHGPVTTQNPSGLPTVQSRDMNSTFAAQGVMPGDPTSFQAPWSFNIPPAGQISGFWSVDGFTFDLLASHIVQQGNGSLNVQGSGQVSHSGFTTTPGTFNFTTQDPAADTQFSFSAATAVPEAGTTMLFAMGALGLASSKLLRRKN
jgi:hypothetical protein